MRVARWENALGMRPHGFMQEGIFQRLFLYIVASHFFRIKTRVFFSTDRVCFIGPLDEIRIRRGWNKGNIPSTL